MDYEKDLVFGASHYGHHLPMLFLYRSSLCPGALDFYDPQGFYAKENLVLWFALCFIIIWEGAGESSAPAGADRIAMMEFYMKKAAQEEKRKQPKQSKDEMPPPASLQAAPSKKGHHMGDYIPQEELEKFLATCNDAAARKAARESAERAKIQSDNVGHKLLSKMGWKEGEGLGSSKSGIADPIMAGNVKLNNLGVGAHQPGEVTPEDDIYEQYKKRMMLGYRYRPNPLNNPRKSYY
ncbi:hypothetical protein CsSME_00024620 [Camellia sinensis var. sinensis]